MNSTLGFFTEGDGFYICYVEDFVNDDDIEIPNYYDDGVNGELPVRAIDGYTFKDRSLNSINLGLVDRFYTSCFENANITAPINFNDIVSCGDGAFMNFKTESTLTFNFSSESFYISDRAFKSLYNSNYGLYINFPSTTLYTSYIGSEAFANLGSGNFYPFLPRIDMGNNTSILMSDNIFKNSSFYETKNVASFGDYMFNSSFGPVSISNNTKNINAKYIFYFSNNFNHLILPSGITQIADYAFANSLFPKFTLSSGMKNTSNYMLSACSNLEEINLHNNVTGYIGIGCFEFCSKLKNINLPPNLKEIKSGAISACAQLENINIPSCEIIQGSAFANNLKLKPITMPKNLKTLDLTAFNNDTNLTRVNFLGNAPNASNSVINANKLKFYRKKNFVTGWSGFLGVSPNQTPVVLWSDNVIKGNGIGKLTTKKRN